jgi:hypothetical protein
MVRPGVKEVLGVAIVTTWFRGAGSGGVHAAQRGLRNRWRALSPSSEGMLGETLSPVFTPLPRPTGWL